jgi:hypothetical protein
MLQIRQSVEARNCRVFVLVFRLLSILPFLLSARTATRAGEVQEHWQHGHDTRVAAVTCPAFIPDVVVRPNLCRH